MQIGLIFLKSTQKVKIKKTSWPQKVNLSPRRKTI